MFPVPVFPVLFLLAHPLPSDTQDEMARAGEGSCDPPELGGAHVLVLVGPASPTEVLAEVHSNILWCAV